MILHKIVIRTQYYRKEGDSDYIGVVIDYVVMLLVVKRKIRTAEKAPPVDDIFRAVLA